MSAATTIRLHDTRRGKKVPFRPQRDGEVTMYLCGPTVYNYAHIGNARPAVVFDLLARVLKRRYKLRFARNITDVDDKINQASIDTGKPINEITAQYIKAYNDDMGVLGVQRPTIEPRATEHIPEMIAMIQTLIDKGYAYEADGHVLFDVEKDSEYGSLSRRNLREMIAGSRVEVAPYKRAPQDFVLWKPSSPELPGWDSPWGRGRPGWHIECSAMAEKHLGETIDIHAGGQDLVFPHHENEMAQSTCAHDGAPFANYWLHNGFLSINQEKMSKSLGNVLLVHDLVKLFPGEVIRLALLSAHYRQPLDWSDETLRSAREKLDRLYGAVRGIELSEAALAAAEPPDAVIEALEDDLNTPRAMAAFFELARELNKAEDDAERQRLAAQMYATGRLLGFLSEDADAWFTGDGDMPAEEIESLLEERRRARADKDFAKADEIRDRLAGSGVQIEDGAGGTIWRRVES
ncbi:MAG: cysteine--tRNA ligase [Woeseiaceae bacterium]|jgi:cysteinyl-tRNA synthetase|nr:cysteine--tRNA ligase [Woeseiaceae bacterium]